MAERLFDLPETKGSFQLKGVVSGTDSSRFFTEKEIKTARGTRNMRTVNFGVNYNENNRLFVNLMGIEQESVYFYNKDEQKTEKVAWSNRDKFNKEGYRLIGNNIGVRKIIDPVKGEMVNDKKLLTDYDSCAEINAYLDDDVSVFIRGDLSYRSYINKNNDKVSSINLVPKQVSLCADIDFNDEKYIQQNDFKQVIVFMGVDKEMDGNDKHTGRFVVTAKIVTYNTIEDAEFIIENIKLANMFRKNLKPYNSIQVTGHMVAEPVVEEVTDDGDEWGEPDPMERIVTPVRREFIITGAKGSTVDKETYTEQNISEAIIAINKGKKAEEDFNSDSDKEEENINDEWGETLISDEDVPFV